MTLEEGDIQADAVRTSVHFLLTAMAAMSVGLRGWGSRGFVRRGWARVVFTERALTATILSDRAKRQMRQDELQVAFLYDANVRNRLACVPK